LKKQFINRNFKKLLLLKEKNREISSGNIKTVGVITEDANYSLLKIKQELEDVLEFNNVKFYSFRPYERKQEVSYKHFTEKDFKWDGKIKQPSFKVFIEEPFDLLIGLFNSKNIYIENAVLLSNAKFKAGISNVNPQLYDLEISMPTNTNKMFFQELKKYLKILKKLKN
jgi:hypothetical protein